MKKHIVCFGDSNTHGYCADPSDTVTGGARFDETERWTCLLQQKLGEEYEWIPKSHDGKPSNDFHWLSHECDAELKSPAGLKYRNVAQRINDAVVGGVEQGVVKDVFVLDFGSTKLPDKFVNQLSLYNARHESHIKELWVFDSEGFHQIVLK